MNVIVRMFSFCGHSVMIPGRLVTTLRHWMTSSGANQIQIAPIGEKPKNLNWMSDH